MINELNKSLVEGDYIIISLGEELTSLNDNEYIEIVEGIKKKLEGNNYFFISTDKKPRIRESSVSEKRIVCPLSEGNPKLEEKQWDFYNKWLASSLGKKLVIVELGEGFNNPSVVRWPFERIVMINLKSKLFRIHSSLFQVPKEIADRSHAIKCNSVDFVREWLKEEYKEVL